MLMERDKELMASLQKNTTADAQVASDDDIVS